LRSFGSFLVVAAIAGIIAVCFGIWDERHHATKSSEKPLRKVTITPPAGASSPVAADANLDLRALAKRARSAVVSIELFDDEHNSIGTGSGFFVSDDGLLVTNYHVIGKASSAVAKTTSGDRLSIKGAVYFDRDNDLAVLLPEGKTFPFLPLGDSSKIEIGDHVAVIGSPLGLEGSLSEGIISGKRDLTASRRALPTPVLSVEHYPPRRNFELPFDKPNWLQITAPISPGSSGSPVLDAKGNVIGIATMVLRGGQSLNFAVPAEVVIAMLETTKEQHGKHRHLVTFKDLFMQAVQTQSIIENVFNLSPEWHDATRASGDSLGEKKEPVNWAKALDLAKIVVDKYPDIVRSWWHLGSVYEKMGVSDEAISAYQQAITLAKEQGDSVSNNSDIETLCWAALGSIFKKTQQMTQAQFAFSQAIAGQTRAIDRWPKAESPPKDYTAEQVSQWRAATAMDPFRGMALKTLADYYAEAGDSERAKQSYLRAIRENPYKPSKLDEVFLYSLADVCAKDSDEAAAFRQLYDAMVLSHHQNPEFEAWGFLWSAYDKLGNHEASDRCLNKQMSVRLKP